MAFKDDSEKQVFRVPMTLEIPVYLSLSIESDKNRHNDSNYLTELQVAKNIAYTLDLKSYLLRVDS